MTNILLSAVNLIFHSFCRSQLYLFVYFSQFSIHSMLVSQWTANMDNITIKNQIKTKKTLLIEIKIFSKILYFGYN